MQQKEIREYNGVPYTTTEADELTQELNDRTEHDVDGYNSISELGVKVLANENSVLGKEDKTNKGVVNGYAELDATGKVPSAQIPAGIDEVQEYANLAAFPAVGEASIIYVALDTNFTYRWSGSTYIQINSGLVLGETDTTAYRGDRGKTAYDHSQAVHAPADATDDQTGAEIKVAYESESNTNAYTDDEKTKLEGIEIGATSDQSQGEIKVAYELNADTNAFTDGEKQNVADNTLKTGVTDEEANTIDSEPIGNEVQVLQVVSITQAHYDLITPVATTFYIISA